MSSRQTRSEISLWRSQRYEIRLCCSERNPLYVTVENRRLCWVDYPIRYGRRVYYDAPGRFPKYVKQRVARILRALKPGNVGQGMWVAR